MNILHEMQQHKIMATNKKKKMKPDQFFLVSRWSQRDLDVSMFP